MAIRISKKCKRCGAIHQNGLATVMTVRNILVNTIQIRKHLLQLKVIMELVGRLSLNCI